MNCPKKKPLDRQYIDRYNRSLCLKDSNVNFHYPTDVFEFEKIISSFQRKNDSVKIVNNDDNIVFGEEIKIDELIVMNDLWSG